MSEPNDYQCSFCDKTQALVKRLIAGPDSVFICDECVALCSQIIDEDNPAQPKDSAETMDENINPKWISQRLNEYVIGQDKAKKVVSVAVYNHYKRIWSNPDHDDEVELQKANILLLGPSGSGKTHLAQTLAKILDVPFAIADATSLTEAGYVGEDVENILLRLIHSADYDLGKAEHGIIYIDEIDKIARKSPNPSITRDVSGEGVQQGLLKIIEGCVANVPPQGGRKHPHQEFLQINTDNILFICGGAFAGVEEIVEKRVFKNNQNIGFSVSDDPRTTRKRDLILEHVTADDLLEYGFIPEFVGRLPIISDLNSLDRNDLVRVLKEPKNSFVKQYESLFKMDNVDIRFTDDALEAAADEAVKRKTGARGLRSILEHTLLEVMYEIPSMPDVVSCVVDANAIHGKSSVTLVMKNGTVIPMQLVQKKSA